MQWFLFTIFFFDIFDTLICVFADIFEYYWMCMVSKRERKELFWSNDDLLISLWYVGMLVLLNSAIISLFLFEILNFLLLLLDYGCWVLLSSYDDKKGERWMQCVRGSYSEIMSLALKSFGCNDWGGAYTYFCFFPSIVLSSSKRGRMLILIPIFWCLQNKWMILISLQDILSVMKLFDSMNKCNWKKTKVANSCRTHKRTISDGRQPLSNFERMKNSHSDVRR